MTPDPDPEQEALRSQIEAVAHCITGALDACECQFEVAAAALRLVLRAGCTAPDATPQRRQRMVLALHRLAAQVESLDATRQ